MPVPEYQTFMRPLLVLGADGEVNIRDCINKIADEFELTPAEREERVPSGVERTLDNRVHWARTYLDKAGALEKTKRAHFVTTDRGRALLKEHPERIDNGVLKQFPEFIAFQTPKKPKSQESIPTSSASGSSDPEAATPEERIDQAYQEIDTDLRDELLTRLLKADPVFFERAILNLMTAMGYGGSKPEAARMTQQSSDNGIDGIINEDPLGLDIIYLQAKRYAPDKAIGREALQAFVGALAGFRASKGVFVTTSRFSKPASEYDEQQKLVLIDGDELTRLMVRYGVGVRTERIIEFRKIDADFFDDLDS